MVIRKRHDSPFSWTLLSNHPNVAIRLASLASLYNDTNRLVEAEPMMRRAVEICEKSLVPNHPWTQAFKQNYAVLQTNLGRQGK